MPADLSGLLAAMNASPELQSTLGTKLASDLDMVTANAAALEALPEVSWPRREGGPCTLARAACLSCPSPSRACMALLAASAHCSVIAAHGAAPLIRGPPDP